MIMIYSFYCNGPCYNKAKPYYRGPYLVVVVVVQVH